MRSPSLTRRCLLAGAAALLSVPALAPPPVHAQPAGARGFDPARLAQAAERARGFDQLHSLVVARGGEIALAEAFRGPPLETPVNIKSVSKTLVAALTGVALARGALPGGLPGADAPGGEQRTLGELAPGLIPPGADPLVAEIRLADLLSLQAGLQRTSGAAYGTWVQSADWVAHALSRPLVRAPGSGMLYSTGSTHVLGAVLAEVTGRSLLDLARAWLGDPLGIAIPPWTRDPQGRYLGGNNMPLSPLALWRFGETARRGGTWEDRAVLPAAWLRASWVPRTRSPFSGHAYGYGWFLASAGGHRVAYARGYGGQMLYVVPDLGLTVAITSDPTRPARSAGYAGELNRLLAEQIVPAAELA